MFQNTILQKYKSKLNAQVIEEKFNQYKAVFQNAEKQQHIRDSKEEQYQEGFLRDLFCAILGYTINPESNFNLITEKKNDSDSRKADGAIIIDEKVKAVIELKGCDTTNLSSIENQAFGYKAHHPGCRYVIISNFEKLRLYVDDAAAFLEFNIFTLTKDQFTLLYLCLALEQIKADIPGVLKTESVSEEKSITDKFYGDYSTFKRNLFEDIVQNNATQYDKLELFKKTQKLLDRLLFILFCEDRGLLPENSILKTIDNWQQLKKLDAYQPLYERYKNYFNRMNTGYKSDDGTMDIFAYNGGLFKPDEILDNITVGDDVLFIYTKLLASYDFVSDVSVDILGHIFEHSLSEIEEIQSQIQAEKNEGESLAGNFASGSLRNPPGPHDVADTPLSAGSNAARNARLNETSKRKKDGVFYTPSYITKYIVENTIGTLCQNKKVELGIVETEYIAKCRKDKKALLAQKLTDYRTYLLSLKICDPACGSGAFLNAALQFLKAEHAFIDELNAKLYGDALVFQEVENSILEHNIYGVDINDESVEIAKLSLWLHTAQKGRKLTTLNNNIKCGNSLIDDPTIAKDKAFDWKKEFPDVFANGGFDVVIGNPPYVNAIELKKIYSPESYNFLKKNYTTAKGTVDLYIYFFEKGLNLLNANGLLSFITPNRYLSASYGVALRQLIIQEKSFYQLIDYSDKKVFEDASTYPVITFIKNNKDSDSVLCGKFDDNTHQLISKEYPSNKLNILEDSILGFLLNDKLPITLKIIGKSVMLSDVGEINATSTASEADEYASIIREDLTPDNGYKLINTGTIDPYYSFWGESTLTKKGKVYVTPYLPKTSDLISQNRHSLYATQKIIISKIGLSCEAFFDKNGDYASIDTNCIHHFNTSKYLPEYILCWLNSKLYNYMFECFFDGLRMSGGYLLYSAPNLINTYIRQASPEEQQPFIDLADKMLTLNKTLQTTARKFLQRVQDNLNPTKISGALETFYTLTFAEFTKELAKQKVHLTLKQQDEWEDYFTEYKTSCNTLQEQITATDTQINELVYNLYGLTEEEVKVVEGR